MHTSVASFHPENRHHGAAARRTCPGIVDDATLRLSDKMLHLSQSSKVMLGFLEFRRPTPPDLLVEALESGCAWALLACLPLGSIDDSRGGSSEG